MSRWDDTREPGKAIVLARPKNPVPGEQKWYLSFWRWLSPRLKHQESQTIRYQDAMIDKQDAENRRTFEEAARIAAEREKIEQETLKAKFENVDSLAGADTEAARKIKLAMLLQQHPEIALQLDKVNEVAGMLALTKDVRIQLPAFDDLSRQKPREEEH